MTTAPDRRHDALEAFSKAIGHAHDGVVACAVRIEDGQVVDFGVTSKGLPDETERTMREVPRKQMQRRR